MALAEISTALATLKIATETGKAIIAAGNAIEVAQLKLQLADLMGSLAEARIALVEAQDRVEEKETQIHDLTVALEAKGAVTRSGDAYYDIDEAGEAVGDGYCLRCWEVDHKLYHLIYPIRMDHDSRCPQCRTTYTYYRTPPINPKP